MKHRKTVLVAGIVGVALMAMPLGLRTAAAGEIQVIIASILSVSASQEDSESVQVFLKEYESTLASGRVESIVEMYADYDETKKPVLEDYFKNVIENLVVRLDKVDIEVDGDRAEVEFDRADAFTDRKTGDHWERSVSLKRKLERDGQSWRIALGG